ncbi:hypothetical protein DSECCO2_627790 [anaerobic digester metagenome]
MLSGPGGFIKCLYRDWIDRPIDLKNQPCEVARWINYVGYRPYPGRKKGEPAAGTGHPHIMGNANGREAHSLYNVGSSPHDGEHVPVVFAFPVYIRLSFAGGMEAGSTTVLRVRLFMGRDVRPAPRGFRGLAPARAL